MKTKSVFVFFTFFLIVHNSIAQSISVIRENYLRAIGGQAKIDSLLSYKVNHYSIINGREVKGIYINKRPYLHRYEVGVDSTSMTCACYDGFSNWMYNSRIESDSFKPSERFPETKDKGLHSQNFLNFFIDYEKNNFSIQLLGVENVDTLQCFKLRLINTKRNIEVFCFINTKNYKMEKEIFSDLIFEGDDSKKITTEIIYHDYQLFEGIYLPVRLSRISHSFYGNMITEMNYHDYQINPVLSNITFECHPNH